MLIDSDSYSRIKGAQYFKDKCAKDAFVIKEEILNEILKIVSITINNIDLTTCELEFDEFVNAGCTVGYKTLFEILFSLENLDNWFDEVKLNLKSKTLSVSDRVVKSAHVNESDHISQEENMTRLISESEALDLVMGLEPELLTEDGLITAGYSENEMPVYGTFEVVGSKKSHDINFVITCPFTGSTDVYQIDHDTFASYETDQPFKIRGLLNGYELDDQSSDSSSINSAT